MDRLASELGGGAHVHQRDPVYKAPAIRVEQGEYLISEGADLFIVALWCFVAAPLVLRHLFAEFPALSNPLQPPAIDYFGVGMPVQLEYPEGISSPPVVLVTVEDESGVVRDPSLLSQLLKAGTIHVITLHRVVEVSYPVEFDGTRYMSLVVQQHVLVRLDDAYVCVVEVLCQPVG